MDWASLSNKSGPADWVMAGAAVSALLLSIFTLIYSRKAINVGAKTKLRPIEMYFTTAGTDNFVVKLSNAGPGIAYDVNVAAYQITGHREKRGLFKGVYRVGKVKKADGMLDVQPNQAVDFIFKDMDVFFLHYNRPISIIYKLASGKKYTTYWNYHMGSSGDKFSQMNPREILKYHLFGRIRYDRVNRGEI